MDTTRQFATIIGKGTNIKGDMSFDTNAAILGGFEGKLTAGGLIQIGNEATCKGEVLASEVVIEGRLEGQVRGTRRVELGATARVTGDVVAAAMTVAPGACLDGHFRIGPTENATVQRPAERRVPAEVGLNGKH